ncbi:HAMP domain-containing sensor histidine kinase [Sulfitobacter sp. LCG007]
MTPERQLTRNLRTIAWTIGAMCLMIVVLLSIAFAVVRQNQQRLAALQIAQYNEKLELERALGYGGMIHHFKNWVLRPDEPLYREGAIESAARALELIDRLEIEADAPELAPRFAAMRQTVDAYRARIDSVGEMHARGLSAREIDEAVRISDLDALQGLGQVHTFMANRMRDTQLALFQRRIAVLVIPATVVLLLSCALVLLIRQRARLKQEHYKARLEDMESFTQVAAHDLRVPLLQISSLLDFARDDLEEVPEAEREKVISSLDLITSRVRKLDEMIRAVFRYLQVEGAAQQVERLDLAAFAREIAALHLPKGADLQIEGDPPVFRAQKVELGIVLRNLISNAVKHHPENRPTVILRYARTGQSHRIEIEDDGKGLREQDSDKVFQMFWTAIGAKDPEAVSGIGLALVRRIVTRWNGNITASNAPGGGAVFAFTIPVQAADRVQTRTAWASCAPTPNTRL